MRSGQGHRGRNGRTNRETTMNRENTKHDIFISYRREGGFETARYLYDHLKWDGYLVTFDLDTLRNGRFDEALLERIDECTDFIAVLNRGCFDRTLDPKFPAENDWLRRELAYALLKGKNVIPVLLGAFEFPAKLPSDIDGVRFLNGPSYSREYIDEFYHKLKTFLKTTPPKAGRGAETAAPAGERGGTAEEIPVLGRPVDEVSLTTLEGADAEKFSAAMAHYRVLRRRSALRELEGIGKQDDPLVRWYALRFRYELDGDVDEETLEKACIAARDRGCTDAMNAFAARHLDSHAMFDAVGKAECLAWLKKAIENGNADALVTLGTVYEDGNRVEKRPELARELYRRAVRAESMAGRLFLGSDYLLGTNGQKNPVEAAKIIRPLLGYFQGMEDELTAEYLAGLGLFNLFGNVLERNPTKGFQYLEKAVSSKGKEIGDASETRALALVFLGQLLLSGEGIERDEKRAFDCFSAAQALGRPTGDAEYWLSQCYEHGYGVDEDGDQAKTWLRKAADMGCSDAQTQLALEYFGDGPERDIQRGRMLLREAAENGGGAAKILLGRMLVLGVNFEQDVPAGMEWLKKAAAEGNGDAMNALGEFFRDGTESIPQDAGEAVAWFRKGAEAGSDAAMTNFGMALLEGTGCRRDVQEAKAWFRKAASGGDADAECALGARFDHGDFGERDLDEAIQWWEKAAEHGNTDAMVNLGAVCLDEADGHQDLREAENWFVKAAEVGDGNAMCRLGDGYREGEFGQTNAEQALKWYRKAASLDHAAAMWALGSMHENGEGVAKDLKAAADWYRRSAEAGDTLGMLAFACALLRGEGVRRDEDAGRKWLEKAFDEGNASAAWILGDNFELAAKDEEGKKRAFEWWSKAAEREDAIGMLRLSAAYRDGIGVEADGRKAFEWLQRSAEAGDEEAMEDLGIAYLTGKGTAIDEEKAREWLVRAAETGNASAECTMGTRFARGDFGEADEEKAVRWWKRAAEHGYAIAMCNLGFHHLNTGGGSGDLDEARKWFRMAEQHGSEDACFFIALDCLGFLGEEPSSYDAWKEKLAAGRDDVEQLERKLKKARSWFARPVDGQSEDSVLVGGCRLWLARIARLTGDEQKAQELYRQSAEDGNEKAAAELKEMERGGGVKEGAVAGVVIGAAIGAAIGAVVPSVGPLVGAGIGAVFGWFKLWVGK